MSSLVAYASSDESDSDDGEENNGFTSNCQSKEKHSEKGVDVTTTRPVSQNEAKTSTTNNSSSNKKNADVGDNSDSDENMFRGFYFNFLSFVTFFEFRKLL